MFTEPLSLSEAPLFSNWHILIRLQICLCFSYLVNLPGLTKTHKVMISKQCLPHRKRTGAVLDHRLLATARRRFTRLVMICTVQTVQRSRQTERTIGKAKGDFHFCLSRNKITGTAFKWRSWLSFVSVHRFRARFVYFRTKVSALKVSN